MPKFLKSWPACIFLLVSASSIAFPQSENDVIINELTITPSSGKAYVELLVLTSSANLQGWTISDCNTRAEATTASTGDITLPSSATWLASVPLGTYVVVELTTPSGNVSTLPQDTSLSDTSRKRLIIKTTTPGVTISGTMDLGLGDNVELFAGPRATGTLIDQVLWGNSAGYIAGASWGDDNVATITDNINDGNVLSAGNHNLRFVPIDQSSAVGFRANGTKTVWHDSLTTYGTPGYPNVGVNDAVLPIQLLSFRGTAANGNGVRLDWATLSEVNNFGFYVQRRAAAEEDFRDLPNSFVVGHGTTLQPQHYTFTDSSATTGQWFYRLKQIDLDGTLHYTDPVQVEVVTDVKEKSLPTAFALEQNFPNPFNPSTEISYELAGVGSQGLGVSHTKLAVYDMLGREVAVLVNERQAPGSYSVTFNANGLASGVYLYRLTAGPFRETKTLMLMK